METKINKGDTTMNRQEYERWEAPARKKPKKGKWFLLGLLVLFVLYFVSGIKVSHHDSNEDKIEIEDQVSSDEVEDNEGFSFQSTLDNQEELNNKTDKVSQISDVAVKKADEVAEQAIEDANKAASQAIENANKAVEEVLGTPYQTGKTETKKQKDDSELSTIEILERRNHARVVEQAKRAGVSTEGSDVEILERINRKHIVERAKREGVSTEGSDVEILERINRKHIVERAKREGVSTEGSDVEILERINHKHIVERAKREGVSTEGSDVEILERINRKHLERYR